MAHQTVLNDQGATKPRSNGLMNDVSSFGNDLAALATLQGKLAAADAKESLIKASPAIAGLIVSSLLCIAGTIVIVGGIALWISEAYAMKLPFALMLTGVGSLVLAAILAAVGMRFIGASLVTFRRSSEEFERNLAWIKTTLTHSGR